MAKKRRFDFYREYLNDFKQNESGEYIYRGATFAFAGDVLDERRFKTAVILLSALAAVFTLAPECLPPTSMSRSVITIIPWAMSLAAVFLTIWASVRLLCRFNDLKEYVYRKTAARLPLFTAAAAVLSGVTLVAQVIYIIVYGCAQEVLFTVLRPVCAALDGIGCLAFTLVVRRAKFRVR